MVQALDIESLSAPGFDARGRPKRGTSYPEIIALVMQEPPDVFEEKLNMILAGDYSVVKTQKEVIVRLAISRAQQSDSKMLDWLSEREEGKVTQSFILAKDDNRAYLDQLRENVALGVGNAVVSRE